MSYSIVSKASQRYSDTEVALSVLNKSDLWIDMSDSACYTLTSTTRINTIVDKSPSPKTITKTGTLFYDTIAKGVRISAGGNYMTASLSSPSTTAVLAQETIFAVVSTRQSSLGGLLGSATAGARWIRCGPTTGYARIGSTFSAGVIPHQISRKYLISIVLLNRDLRMFYNGAYDGSGVSQSFTAQDPTQTIGSAQNNSTYPMNGTLYEIVMYQTALSDTQRRAVEYYLMKKWDIDYTGLISSPTSITGCTLWLDGNDASTITYSSGTSVSQWNDKSGNNYHGTQSTAIRQPTYDSTLKGCLFNQTNNTNFQTTAPWSRTETIFMVVNLATGATPGVAIGTTNASRGRNIRLSPTAIQFYSDSTALVSGQDGAMNTTDKYLLIYFNSVADGYFEATFNGIQTCESNAALNYTAGTFTNVIGATTSTGAVGYASYIYEMIVYNSALSVADRLSVQKYLTNKWSLVFKDEPRPIGRAPYYSNLPYTRLFSPVDFENLIIWLDAADTTTLSLSGTNVTQWNDKSGNGNNAVAGTSTYPVFATNTLNGLPTIQLRGSNDYFLVSNNLTTGTYPSLCYLAVVNISASQPSGVSRGAILSTDSAGIYGRSLGIISGSYEEEYYSNFTTLTAYSAGNWAVVTLQFTGVTNGSTIFTLNGTSYTGIVSGSGTNTTGLKIGSYNSSGTPAYSTFNANFDVAEILVYGTNLSIHQRQVLEGYLAWKWGLRSNLVSTHLYKTAFPSLDIFDVRNTNSTITLWVDAADTTTLTLSGSNVTSWTDRLQYSGSTTNFAGTATYTLIPSRVNFDGATVLQFNTTNANTMFQNISYMACFAVVSTSTANGVIFCAASSSGGLMRFDCRISGQKLQANARRLTTDGASSLTGPTTVPLNTLILAGFIADVSSNNDLIVYYNGTQDAASSPFPTTGTTSNTADDFISLAGRSSLVSHPALSGTICEVVVFNRIITTFDRQLIEGELAWKWGIQSSLPSTHPYYKYPPY